MKRKELIESMQKFTKSGYIIRDELKEYMGYKDPHDVDKFLKYLERIGKKYFIPDVADSIMSQREVRA